MFLIVAAPVSYFVSLSIIKGNPEREFESRMKSHEFLLLEYKKAKDRYDKLITEYNLKKNELSKFSGLTLNGSSSNQLSKYLLSIYFRKHKRFEEGGNMKVGASENRFFKVLESQFSGKIFQNTQLVEKEFNYYPDFVYYDKTLGVCIDIEIDEPYSLDEKMVIHEEGVDDKRNYFFNKNNWIVVRFTEKQVVKEPKECCNVISNVVSYLNLEINKLTDVVDLSLITNEIHWDYTDAEEMIKNGYRERYLGIKRAPTENFLM